MDFGETQFAQAAGDVDIAYRVFGSGPLNIVIVPGIFSHLDLFFTFDQFCDFMEKFAAFSRVATFDKRGTGLSDPTPGAAELDERMDDIRAVMDATRMDSAAIMGISEGGTLALMFAATYPERTRAVVLAGSYGRLPPGEFKQKFEWAMDHWGTGDLSLAISPGLRKSNFVMRRSVGFIERASASPRMARSMLEFVKSVDVRSIVPAIQAPLLAVHRADEVVPIDFPREVVDAVPDGQLVVLDGDDHLPWLGDTDEYVGVIEEFLTGSKHRVEPDRGLSTVLFTDIVSSTSRNAELGDDAWRRLLDRHNELVREALASHRGREIKTIGDGFLSTFDGPARALRCAKTIVDGVSDLGISVRAGLHTGEVDLYPNGDIGGMAVNLGARIGAAADGGEVLVSSTIKDLVFGSGFRFVPRGEHELKGVPGSWPLYALEGEGRPDAPAEAAIDQLGPYDRARVQIARRFPRAARTYSRLLASTGDETVRPRR
jgi:class 3 adenylate cyclase